MEKRTCKWCEHEYLPRRYDQVFCKRECRVSFYNHEAGTVNKEKKRESDRLSYQRRKEGISVQKTIYRQKNIDEIRARDNAYGAAYRQQLKAQIIEKYGRCCRRCGFSDPRALQIDHINGGGTKEHNEKKSSFGFMRKVLLDEPNKEFQLLCANCNQIKRYENGEGVGKRRTQTKQTRKY